MLGVVTALPIEARCLSAKNTPVLLRIAGIGAERAKIGALELVAAGASALVSWGTAGGLAPQVQAGDILIPEHVIDMQQNQYRVNAEWRAKLIQALQGQARIITGPLLQSSDMVNSVAQKQRLYWQYSAIAVDMESAAVASVAQNAGLPFLVIRAVVDSGAMHLPNFLGQVMSPEGQIRPMRLVAQLCRDPRQIPTLFRLGHCFSAARRSLATVGRLTASTLAWH